MAHEADGVHLVLSRRDEATLVTITGVLQLSSYPEVRDGLLKSAAEPSEGLVADIGGTHIVDASLATVFAVVARRIGDWPGLPFAVVSARPEHQAMFVGRPLGQFVPLHSDFASAVRSFDHPVLCRAKQTLVRSEHAAAAARRLAEAVCEEWKVPELLDEARLIATELVENVIRHTASVPLLRLELRQGVLTVAVTDDDPRPAERQASAGSGLGLHMVARTAKVWGCSRTWSGGKVVWAVLVRPGGGAVR
ncbi:ATP-binding protein [Amycolatopsis sp. NPDC059021]|uniref:ATP-binding protein n=1 Tax=Amycolatopsis sp. NPDC059021 TaxID=3346704 RepID=UPI0036727CED